MRVRQVLLSTVFLAAFPTLGFAADLPVKAPVPPPAPFWSWTGFYGGVHLGAVAGNAHVGDPFGPSIFGDNVFTTGAIGGIQAGYNFQNGAFVFGIEGDFSGADTRGTNTCFAFSGLTVSANCRVNNDWFATLTGRAGLATGTNGHTLLYAKGGAAATNTHIDLTTNNLFGVFVSPSNSVDTTRWGWTVGAGIEHAFSPAWSLKLEYNYMDFGRFGATSPASLLVSPAGVILAVVPPTATRVNEQFHAVKVGLNYRFGQDPWATWGAAAAAPFPTKAPVRIGWAPGWEFDIGGRYWFSSGRFQKDLPAGPTPDSVLISRLTYDGLTAHSGEAFARIDTPINVFVKGILGGGRIVNGHMNDEDWGLGGPPFTSYSNTISSLTNTSISYASADVGYNVFRGTDYKVGVFAGYHYSYEQMAANTCTQIASPASGICAPPIIGVPVITETDRWNAVRIGIGGEVMLWDRVKLSAEAAYLPFVDFKGVDNHWLRALVIDENGRGRGVQVEAILSYYVTPQFSVGVGGRYWAMWTTSGSDAFNGVPIDRNDFFRMERYGGFFQAAYKFGYAPAVVASY